MLYTGIQNYNMGSLCRLFRSREDHREVIKGGCCYETTYGSLYFFWLLPREIVYWSRGRVCQSHDLGFAPGKAGALIELAWSKLHCRLAGVVVSHQVFSDGPSVLLDLHC